jgi:hypothetical protein
VLDAGSGARRRRASPPLVDDVDEVLLDEDDRLSFL